MRNLVIVLLVLYNTCAIAQWNRISSSDTTFTYSSIWFLNKDTGFVCGHQEWWNSPNNSIILRTMDGGSTWDTVFSNSTGLFLFPMSIQFINDSIGYCGGQDGYIYHTFDMGSTWIGWNNCFLGDDFSSLFFPKVDTGFVHTFDGCLERRANNPPCTVLGCDFGDNYFPGTGSLRFLNENDGYVAGGNGRFARTADRGNTWQAFNNPDTSIEVLCAWMSDTSHGVMAGTNGKVAVTNDGGNTWSPITTISQYSILDMSFINTIKGYAVGGIGIWWWTVPSNERRGVIWKTQDGGYTWVVDDSSFSNNVISIFIVNDTLAYAAGNYGLILKNSNLFYDGINENASQRLNIYPNPVTNELRIQNAESGIKKIEIYNAIGERVYKSETRNPKSEIDVSHLKEGIYFVKLTGDKTNLAGKFVKE